MDVMSATLRSGLLPLTLLITMAGQGTAQTDYLVDFGTSSMPSGPALPWAGVHPGNRSIVRQRAKFDSRSGNSALHFFRAAARDSPRNERPGIGP